MAERSTKCVIPLQKHTHNTSWNSKSRLCAAINSSGIQRCDGAFRIWSCDAYESFSCYRLHCHHLSFSFGPHKEPRLGIQLLLWWPHYVSCHSDRPGRRGQVWRRVPFVPAATTPQIWPSDVCKRVCTQTQTQTHTHSYCPDAGRESYTQTNTCWASGNFHTLTQTHTLGHW